MGEVEDELSRGDSSRRGQDRADPPRVPRFASAARPGKTAESPDDIAELIEFCETGRVYAVERWISSGRPLQWDASGSFSAKTPLVVAIKSNQYDLARLLLCNGYRPDLEPRQTLRLVLDRKAWDYLELLLAWGADPMGVFRASVLQTYEVALIERFWKLGMDFTENNYLASHLSTTTSNKPAYGWARRHREDPRVAYQLALALGDAVFENREKAVCLLLWAGADPHRQVPSLRWGSGVEDDPNEDRQSAIECAVDTGYGKLLRHLKPDPALDDFEKLYAVVCDPDAVDYLFDLEPPADWSKTIVRCVSQMPWTRWAQWEGKACLERIFEHHWGRLNTLEESDCRDLRRTLLKIESNTDLAWLLEKLAKPQHCDEAVFAQLVRTPSIKKRIVDLNLTRLLPQRASKRTAKRSTQRRHQDRKVRTRADWEKEYLAGLDPETRTELLRGLISREQLYKEVWSDPVTVVAARYGMSDVGVAKWCKKLNVPRPWRGYWARKSAGHRLKKTPLPKAGPNQQRYVGRPKPEDAKKGPAGAIAGLDLFEKPIPVPDVPNSPHPLVAATRRALKSAERDEYGLLHPRAKETLDVCVSRACIDRALKVMNAFIVALERAGFAVETTATLGNEGNPGHPTTHAVINDERVEFSMGEKTRRDERPPTTAERLEMRQHPWESGPFYKCSSTGELYLQIENDWHRSRHRRTWSDDKRGALENHLYSFVRSLLMAATTALRRRGAVDS